MAGAVEYFMAEVMELAAQSAQENKRVRITPRDMMFAVKNDEELNHFLGRNAIFRGAGVVPKIHPALLPKRTLEQKKQNE